MLIEDFNINFMIDSFYARKLQTTMLSIGMKQYVPKLQTRIIKNSQTIIDLIFSNKKLKVHVSHEPKIMD